MLFVARKKLTFITFKNQELHNISNNLFNHLREIINQFLLTGDKFISELNLKQPGFTYSACGPFTKHREEIKKFRETRKLKKLNKNELDKACFAHDAAYSNSEDSEKITILDKILKDRAYEIARNCNYDGYQ